MDLSKLAKAQYEWVESMNWHNKTVIEAICLIGSEIGESVNECIDGITNKFGEELADICLRTIDLAEWQKIDLSELKDNLSIEFKSKTTKDKLLDLIVDWSNFVNSARKEKLTDDFEVLLKLILIKVNDIAISENIDIIYEIMKKMEKNLTLNKNGRII